MREWSIYTARGVSYKVPAKSWQVEGHFLRFYDEDGDDVVCFSLHQIVSWELSTRQTVG